MQSRYVVDFSQVHHIREKFVAELRKQFPEMGLVYSIGGLFVDIIHVL